MKKEERNNLSDLEFEESSGNVFADLGLDDAEELQDRARIGVCVVRLLKQKMDKERLIQQDVALRLGIKQPEVSHLLNGHFSRFTIDKLLDLLKRLDQKVTIHISPREEGEHYVECRI